MLARTSPVPAERNPAEISVRGSSFFAAMRIMPARERAAMYEIYHFCRVVDDIADSRHGRRENQLAALERWRQDIGLLYTKNAPPSIFQGLAAAISAFHLRQHDFLAVIDGMEMDVRGPIQAPDAATLALYCDRVACAAGRLSVRVFGLHGQDGLELAHHLGMALQLTNILRDLDEDCAMNRLYLPRELLEEAGILTRRPAQVLANPAVGGVCLCLAWRALEHFEAADQIMQHCRSAQVRTPRIMSQAYHDILSALIQRGFASPRQEVRLSKARLGTILIRNML